MSSYIIIKIHKKRQTKTFLMANAAGTRTFKNDLLNAWSTQDARKASDMMTKCIEKHKDKDIYTYLIDDIDESSEW